MSKELRQKLAGLYELGMLERARALASMGDFQHAEEALDRLEKTSTPSCGSCDIRARICAQTGRYRMARQSWQKARELSAGSQSYAAELAALERYERWPVFMQVRRFAPAILVVLAFVLYAGWLTLNSSRPTTPARAPWHIPDASVTYRDGRIELRFEHGLFDRGAELNEQAGKILDELARQLRESAQPYSIFIRGHTNDLPLVTRSRYPDNYALGLARAQAVLQYLRSVAGLKDGKFVLGSAGEIDPPFPNDAHEGRYRNKTVTIVLSPDIN